MGGILAGVRGHDRRGLRAAADAFLRTAQHPTLGRGLRDCGYLPMVELLRYLEANGFTTFIASGGDRDFMRPVTDEIYGIPRERVVGSSDRAPLPGRTRAARSSTRRRWTCSTTAR